MTKDKPICDNCGFEFKDESKLNSYNRFGNEDDPMILCELCSHTFFSHAIEYPNSVSDVKLYKCIAYLGNMILQRIDSLKEEKNATQ